MKTTPQLTGTSVEDLGASFLRSLRAENKAARTVETYGVPYFANEFPS